MEDNYYTNNYFNAYKKEYDLLARQIMSTKQILANVLKYLVKEYENLSIEDIYKLISEGDGSDGKYIKGINTNDIQEHKEIRHDIVFTPKLPNSEDKIGMYIGIEPQKDKSTNVSLLFKRGLYYDARLISRQANEAFINSKYENLKKTYSIWILFNPRAIYRNSILKFSHAPYFDTSKYPVDYDIDYANIIFLNMGKDYSYDEDGLLEMLSLLFNSQLTSKQAVEHLKKRYNVDISKEDINKMYGFSYGIEQAALEEGMQKGIEQGLQKGIEQGLQQGLQQGIQQGIQQGLQQGIIDTIINMIASGISEEKAFEIAKASDEIKSIVKDSIQKMTNEN